MTTSNLVEFRNKLPLKQLLKTLMNNKNQFVP